MEMETAVRHNSAVIIVVANNDGNTGALMQKTFFPSHPERITRFDPCAHLAVMSSLSIIRHSSEQRYGLIGCPYPRD
jgi:hypothetical protein